MRSTGIKRYIDPISGCKIWRTNHKCRIPIDLYPCKVEESMTMKKVGDQTIGVIQRRRIDNEGNVSMFQEYHTSDEEEEELKGNMNGWLIDDANDSDLESTLERDNRRLRDMIDVASQRVTRSQHRELRVQREMRQIRRFRFYDRMRIARLEACARRHLDYRALGTRDATKNLEPLIGGGGKQDEISGNGGNRNRGNRSGGNGNKGNGNGGANGNGNGNRGGNGYNLGGFVHVSRECTYQDFLKCQPLSFNGTEGVVGITRWFEKMKTVFHISNCPEKYQVKYDTFTLLNSALTWWNSHKRTIRIESAYAMSWTELMKLMTEVYYPRNKIQKMETVLILIE
ncbi:hypothetical protein Tco_1254576 [Tanacetum coccineum]